jgi:23S rRNA pseudouridine1911/1915/1917 synthase
MTALPRKGRPAVTRYDTMETLGNFSLVRLKPETGRTHQLRVHLTHVHHPVIGDEKYGRRSSWNLMVEVKRQMLHAHKIRFRHPVTGESVEFTAPMPDDMARILDYLRHINREIRGQRSEIR